MATAKERAAQILIVSEVNKAIDLLEAHFKKFCTNNNTKSVPMDYISTSIKIFKESYNEAAKK